jgi:hypothetical protein
VVEIAAWRQGRVAPSVPGPARTTSSPLALLERAIARLDPLVTGGTGRLGPRVETELLAITGAVTAGRVREAAVRAERLAVRLEHPSSHAAQ